MNTKTGKNLEWVKTMSLQQPNLKWSQNSTASNTIIRIINPAPVHLKR